MRDGHNHNASNEAERASHEKDKPKPWWWLGQTDPVARYTKWLSIYTGLLVFATGASVYILHETDVTLNKQRVVMEAQLRAMENDQRPWVGFSGVTAKPVCVVYGYDLKAFGFCPSGNLMDEKCD